MQMSPPCWRPSPVHGEHGGCVLSESPMCIILSLYHQRRGEPLYYLATKTNDLLLTLEAPFLSTERGNERSAVLVVSTLSLTQARSQEPAGSKDAPRSPWHAAAPAVPGSQAPGTHTAAVADAATWTFSNTHTHPNGQALVLRPTAFYAASSSFWSSFSLWV